MENSDLKDDIRLVLHKYPKLELVDNVLSGEIDIFDKNDTYYSSYQVKIIIPREYPHEFPSVNETEGRIPRIADRHINDEDGDCCLCVLQEADIRAKRGITILNFIDEYVIPFFANQVYFESNGNGQMENINMVLPVFSSIIVKFSRHRI
ncbi:MAG: hypothetical protein LBE13_22260 [Bacteroidales bacterium]|jgi:ubiquitin-protein ligase|nr:hypothetical protein [Bacteroidales bacterium]